MICRLRDLDGCYGFQCHGPPPDLSRLLAMCESFVSQRQGSIPSLIATTNDRFFDERYRTQSPQLQPSDERAAPGKREAQLVKILRVIRRFAMPGVGATLLFYFRYRAFLSPRAEVDLSPQLHVGRKTRISSFVKIKVSEGPVHIGQRCAIASGAFISSGAAGTRIGDDCMIGPNCTVVSSTYRYDRAGVPFEKQGTTSKGTSIGNNVFIGSNCSIVDGAVIGDNVMVGAQSFVSSRIPENSVAQGCPAKVMFTLR